jgi:hypothetical protein
MRLDDLASNTAGIEMTNTIDGELAGCELDSVSGGTVADVLPSTSWAFLGSMPDGDIMALSFIVCMQAAKAAQQDVRGIMGSINHHSRVRH